MELTASYDRLIADGLQAQPPPEVPEPVKKQARNLLLRMERRKTEVLLFLTDFNVPFDRNERRSQRQRSPVPPNSTFASVGLVRHAGWRPTRLGSRLRSRALDHASGTLVEHAVPWLALC
jgi:hypothetical protein